MTIAQTGNRIVDAQARRGAAQQKLDDGKAKASARKAAGRSKTTAKAKAGRSAIKDSKGRGIAGSSHKNRAGASVTIEYAIEKPDARFLCGNAGLNSTDIATSFKLAQSTRQDIKKNTGHMSFSLPRNEVLTDTKWVNIVYAVLKELRLDDGFPYVAGIHSDTGCQHLHIAYSRVSYDGRVHDDRFLKLRMAAAEDLLENRFKLKVTPKNEFDIAPKYKIGEAVMAARTGIKPPRFVINTEIMEILSTNPPNPMAFIRQLAERGVIARPAVKNGKMNGFSFQYDGVEFGASKISNELGWSKLKKVIHYEPVRDDKPLANFTTSLPDRPSAASIVASTRAQRPINQVQQLEPPIISAEEKKPTDENRNGKSRIAEVLTVAHHNSHNNNDFYMAKKLTFDEILRKKHLPDREEVIYKLHAVIKSGVNSVRQEMAESLLNSIILHYSKIEIKDGFLETFENSQQANDFFEEFIKINMDTLVPAEDTWLEREAEKIRQYNLKRLGHDTSAEQTMPQDELNIPSL